LRSGGKGQWSVHGEAVGGGAFRGHATGMTTRCHWAVAAGDKCTCEKRLYLTGILGGTRASSYVAWGVNTARVVDHGVPRAPAPGWLYIRGVRDHRTPGGRHGYVAAPQHYLWAMAGSTICRQRAERHAGAHAKIVRSSQEAHRHDPRASGTQNRNVETPRHCGKAERLGDLEPTREQAEPAGQRQTTKGRVPAQE